MLRDHDFVSDRTALTYIVRNTQVVMHLRPGLRSFLEFCFRHFDVAFWSAGVPEYVDKVVQILLEGIQDLVPDAKPVFVWNKTRCIDESKVDAPTCLERLTKSTRILIRLARGDPIGTVKPLYKVWRRRHGPEQRKYHRRETLHVDDRPYTFSRNYGNGIPVTPWHGDPDDRELVVLAAQLQQLLSVEDVRTVETRLWHDA
jgi:RNA polymerase II subunit A small phosphatase-like protein